MRLVEVIDQKSKGLFHRVLDTVYQNDPYFIYPLENDIEEVFNKNTNPSLEKGEVVRYVALDAGGKPVGRIAAFYDPGHPLDKEHPIGGCGFFESLDKQEIANLLLDKAREWLEKMGFKGMDGPINFGERDKFWGCLLNASLEPSYLESYNPPYYAGLLEQYGFKEYFRQYTFRLPPKEVDGPRITRVAEWILRKPGIRFEHLNVGQIDHYAEDFVAIYNQAWSDFDNFKPIKKEGVIAVFKAMKPIIDEKLIWFGYVNNEPAGVIVMLPDVNQLFKYLKGRLDLLGKLKFLFYKKTKGIDRVKGLVFGVVPKYQKHGLDAVLVYKVYQRTKTHYKVTELSWIGSFNPKMISLMKNINATVAKTHVTYRYLFDKSLPFKPFEIS